MSGKVLITGAGGFIGRSLTRYLRAQERIVLPLTSKELDVRNAAAFDAYMGEDISNVIHLAARTFVPKSWEDPGDCIGVNAFGTLNVLEYCRKKKVPLTYISAYIYGQPKYLPIREGHPLDPNNPYAKSKQMAEELCQFYATQMGVKVCIVRPFNVFGPGQRGNFLIPLIINQVLHKEAVTVMDLSPKRDYIYITDLLDAISLCLDYEEQFDIFNIGSGASHSVEEIIALVQEIAKTDKPVISKEQVRKNELNDVVADISHARISLGWEAAYSLEDGLREMIDKIKRAELAAAKRRAASNDKG